MVDSSTKDIGAIKHLRDNGQLRRRALIGISEFTKSRDADVEDLFEPDFYVELVNRAYSPELTTPITRANLNVRDPRIVRQIEEYFRSHGVASGRFNHYRPAACLLREQTDLVPKISATTLLRAQQFFARLNSLLPTV